MENKIKRGRILNFRNSIDHLDKKEESIMKIGITNSKENQE